MRSLSRFSSIFSILTEHLAPQWPRMALLATLLLIATGLQVLNPQLVRLFIDAALGAGTESVSEAAATSERLTWAAALFLASGLLNQLLSAGATYVANDVGWTATNRLRADLALHCLKLDMTFHNARTPGELIERIDGDVSALANFFSAFTVRIVGSVLLLLGVIVMLAREDWRVAVVLVLFTATVFYGLERLRAAATPRSKVEREASAQLMGFLEERLNGIDDIRANGAGEHVMRRFYETNRRLFHAGRRSWLFNGAMWGLTMIFFGVAQAVALGLGYSLFSGGEVTLGTVYLISHYTGMLIGPVERITNEMQDFQRAASGMERVQELYGYRSVVGEGSGGELPDGPLSLEFDGVTFVYPDAVASGGQGTLRSPAPLADMPHFVGPSGGSAPEPPAQAEPVLESVTFRLGAGKTLGLLGRTGSGKTTATRLLFRLYDPTEGAVRLGGVDLREPALEALRKRVAVVTQDVQLISGTVRDNLTLFDREVSDERIEAVMADLGLSEWVRSLPNGLDTVVGAGGRGLSAGEAQLLAFTRAFLADPSVVVLDEASSRLDLATEQLIERAVDRLLADRTGVVIAHRLATVQRADEILVLEEGRVLEHGERAALASDPDSRYAQLLKTGLAEVLV